MFFAISPFAVAGYFAHYAAFGASLRWPALSLSALLLPHPYRAVHGRASRVGPEDLAHQGRRRRHLVTGLLGLGQLRRLQLPNEPWTCKIRHFGKFAKSKLFGDVF